MVLHYLKLWVKRFISQSVIEAVRKPIHLVRSWRKEVVRSKQSQVSFERLIADLKKTGIGQGDTIMVHSALSRIGNVEGGSKTVIQSLIQILSSEGTLIMPCYNSAEVALKNLRHGKLVDLRTSSSEVGIITETFRTWDGVKRSSHPFSSVCAWGRHCDKVTFDHAEAPNVCHEHSPVGHLVQSGGKVIGIGISVAQGLGVAHYLEDTWEEFPFEVHQSPISMAYINTEGERIEREIRRFDPHVARTRIDYPQGAWIREKLTSHLSRCGILVPFTYGEAESWIMDAQELYVELKRLAKKGVTMYLTEDNLTDGNRDFETW